MPQFDAIVVGSGISGGWAAKELTERGLRVLLLERGRNVDHGKDYVGEHKAPWEFPFRSAGDKRLYESEYPVQKQCYALNEGTRHFFVNDINHPYQTGQGEFSWIRGYHLGGRSLTWGRASFRLSDVNIKEQSLDNLGVDWPIGYKDLDPWYSHVEKYIGVNGMAESLEVLPDGEFQPAMGLNCVERLARANIQKAYPNRVLTQTRSAILTQPKPGRAPCHYCGPCQRGCSTGSYFSSLSSTLPAARATNRLTVITDAIVDGIDYDPELKRVTGVRIIDSSTKRRSVYSAKVVF